MARRDTGGREGGDGGAGTNVRKGNALYVGDEGAGGGSYGDASSRSVGDVIGGGCTGDRMMGSDGGGSGGNKGVGGGACSNAIDDVSMLEGACIDFERAASYDDFRSGGGGGGKASNVFDGGEKRCIIAGGQGGCGAGSNVE